MLALKNFDLSGAELGKTLRSCPCLTRLELEHVSLSENYVPANDLENHAEGLRELLLVNTKPMAWFCDLLQKVHTLEPRGGANPTRSMWTTDPTW